MFIIKYGFDGGKCFLINYIHMWCVTLIPVRFCVQSQQKAKIVNIRTRHEICSNLLVGLKITAVDPSTAIHNAKEIMNALTNFYGSKENVPPILMIFIQMVDLNTTAYSLVWCEIAVIVLKKHLDVNFILAYHTALGHSFRNHAEKINCVLFIYF